MSAKTFIPACQEFDRSADSSVEQGLFQLADSRCIGEAPNQRVFPTEPTPTLAALPMLPATAKTREQLMAEFDAMLAKIKDLQGKSREDLELERQFRERAARPKLYPYRG